MGESRDLRNLPPNKVRNDTHLDGVGVSRDEQLVSGEELRARSPWMTTFEGRCPRLRWTRQIVAFKSSETSIKDGDFQRGPVPEEQAIRVGHLERELWNAHESGISWAVVELPGGITRHLHVERLSQIDRR
jgi:hypothetical protein